jgi:hypothetical protein
MSTRGEVVRTTSGTQDEQHSITQQLQDMSARLNLLQLQLSNQRDKCSNRVEQRYLDQISKDIKKQSVAMHRLRDSIDNTSGILRRSMQAQRHFDSPCEAANLNDLLFRTVAQPFDGKHRLLQKKTKKTSVASKLVPRAKPAKLPWELVSSGSETSRSSSPFSSKASTSSSISEPEVVNPSADNEPPPAPPKPSSPILQAPATKESERASIAASSDYSSPSSPARSTTSSPSITLQDWSILTPPEGLSLPPPLPRKSSRRTSYVPRVPSLKRNASVKSSSSIKRQGSVKSSTAINRQASIKSSSSIKRQASVRRAPPLRRKPAVSTFSDTPSEMSDVIQSIDEDSVMPLFASTRPQSLHTAETTSSPPPTPPSSTGSARSSMSIRRKAVASPRFPPTSPIPAFNRTDSIANRISLATIAKEPETAQDIVNRLEKRFSGTMTTPPTTPKFELGSLCERKPTTTMAARPRFQLE